MREKSCCFEGNFSYDNLEEIKRTLKKEIKNVIKKFEVTEFYVGAGSDFDRLCLDCLEEIQGENLDIKLCLVLTEPPSKSEFSEAFLEIFDEITHLNFEKISPQFVKLSTFNWLIDNSDYLISTKESSSKQAPELVIRDLSDKDLLFFTVRLKMLRIKSGLSQVELAKAVNVSPSAIGMYEQGRREPDFPTFLSICLVLGTTPNYILGQDKKFKPCLIEIDEVLSEFTAGIRKNNRLLCNGEPIDKAAREKFALSLIIALEVAKKFVTKKYDLKAK